MLKRYEDFLKVFDTQLKKYFEHEKKYIKCKKGCACCCEIGEYPFSRLEAEYLMSGFIQLPVDIQKIIKQNIQKLLNEKQESTSDRFEYCCPFLINKECSLYKYRGIVCRTFGLAYAENNKIRLPECVNFGLNYSEIYDKSTQEIMLENPIKESLRIDNILRSKIAEKYQLECGKIQPLINWFSQE